MNACDRCKALNYCEMRKKMGDATICYLEDPFTAKECFELLAERDRLRTDLAKVKEPLEAFVYRFYNPDGLTHAHLRPLGDIAADALETLLQVGAP